MAKSLISKDLEEYTISLRRYFHQHPELSLKEVNTCRRITEELEGMGLKCDRVPPNSIVACLEGEPGGKSIAIRADIDALPMKEQSDYPFRSITDEAAHTCGHDAHTAILLGAAKYLCEHHEGMKGKIYFCFQCAEEIAGDGAPEIVKYLKEKGGVDQAYGLHVVPELCTGEISIEAGPRMAGAGRIDVTVIGRGGHGSRPDRCLDPIRPACEMIQKMSAFPSNHHNALEPTVINMARIHAGTTAHNIVPETAEFSGSIRFFTPGLSEKIDRILRRMAEGTAASYGVKADVNIHINIEPVINAPESSAIAAKAVSQIEGLCATEVEPDMGSDDFADFVNAFPGMYAFLGIAESLETAFPHHHPQFHIDETALKYGVEFFVRYAKEFMQF